MPQGTKIATCTYCGTRAALVLAGTVRHELACSNCGAPLHDLKMLPARQAPAATPARGTPNVRASATPQGQPDRKAKGKHHPSPAGTAAPWGNPGRKIKKKVKKKKSTLFKVFDLLEDLLD